DPTFEPDCLTWLPSTRKYHGEYACHSNIPPVSLRWKPRSSACHPAGLGCGKLAVRFAVPAPVNGVKPLNRRLCGIQFVYARARKTSYMPPRRLTYMSSRPKFSP